MSPVVKRQMLVYCLLGLLSVCVSLITGIGLFVLVMSLVLMYMLIPLPDAVNRPVIRACFAVVLQLALFNAFGLLLYLIKVDISATMYGIASLLIVSVVFIIQLTANRLPKYTSLSWFDLMTIIPVLLGLAILIIYIFGNGLSFSENLIRFMGSSSDQSAHLSMFSDILRNDGNHVYSTDKLSINTPGINSYPMGWHQSMAVLTLNLFCVQITDTPFIGVVILYFFCALLTFLLYGLAIAAFTAFVYDRIYSKKASKMPSRRYEALREVLVKSFVVLAVIFLFLYITLCELGYTNFIYAAAIVLLSAVFMMGLSRSDSTTAGVLFMLISLLFVATEAWYIMSVPVGIALVYLSVVYLRTIGFKAALKRGSTWLLLVGYLLVGLAFIIIIRNILVDGSGEQIQIGNTVTPWLPDTLLLLTVVVSAILFSNSNRIGLLHIIVNGFFVSILLLTFLNFLHLQAYSYYQQKMLYALFALSIPIVFIALIKLIERWGIKLPLILTLIPFLVYMINPGNIVYITRNIMRPNSDPEIGIIDHYFQSRFNDRSEVVFIKDYRTRTERFTESYARLLLSKVVSPGDCYNQLIMPLLSLSNQSGQSQIDSNSAADEVATSCYSNVKFIHLSDGAPVVVE